MTAVSIPKSLVLPIIVLLCFASRAFAHRMIVTCTVEPERVRVEAFFEDDTPAQEATVTISAAEGERIVAEGKTDERGLWHLKLPPQGTYVAKVTHSGHSASKTFNIFAGELPAPVSTQPTREELTAFPWVKVAIGLGIIAGICVLVVLARKSPPPNQNVSPG